MQAGDRNQAQKGFGYPGERLRESPRLSKECPPALRVLTPQAETKAQLGTCGPAQDRQFYYVRFEHADRKKSKML